MGTPSHCAHDTAAKDPADHTDDLKHRQRDIEAIMESQDRNHVTETLLNIGSIMQSLSGPLEPRA